MIYVVCGSTGEYSDRTDWLVKAFRTEDAAKATIVRLSELARIYEQRRDAAGDTYYDLSPSEWTAKNAPDMLAADPKFDHDHTGTRYSYEAIELEDPANV